MASSNSLNGDAAQQTLKGRTSATNLQAGRPSGINTTLARKSSGSRLGSPLHSPGLPVPTTPKGRRPEALGLTRSTSNATLKQLSPNKSMHATALPEPQDSPKLSRTYHAPGFPSAPSTPAGVKSIRPPQSGPRIASRQPKPQQVVTGEEAALSTPRNSDLRKTSQSLRDTIRAAREAKQRASSVSTTDGTTTNSLDGFDFGTQQPEWVGAPPEIVIGETGSDSEDEATKDMIKVGRGGMLDLSGKALAELSAELIDSVLGSPYTLILSNNLFAAVPMSMDRFASLTLIDLSGNRFDVDYLPERLMLRSLDTLNLRNTGITTLAPLFACLDAPKLATLDVSANRLTSIDGLRGAFPALQTLLASDNQVAEIPIESIDGVRLLDLAGNAITTLPPQLALLQNLRELRVQGNLFRVPRWQVLEKGTDAVMSWLHDRLPTEDGGEGDGEVE